MSGINSDFKMNVMKKHIAQVTKWEAWAVLEQRYNMAKWLNRTAGTESEYQSTCTWPGKFFWLKGPGNSIRSLLLKYGPVGNVCYCFTVVDVVPSGKIISQKMTAYLEEVGLKKRNGETLLNEAKRMQLASDSVSGRYMFPPILISFNLKVYGDGVLMCL